MLNFLIHNKGILPLIKNPKKYFMGIMGSYLKKKIQVFGSQHIGILGIHFFW